MAPLLTQQNIRNAADRLYEEWKFLEKPAHDFDGTLYNVVKVLMAKHQNCSTGVFIREYVSCSVILCSANINMCISFASSS